MVVGPSQKKFIKSKMSGFLLWKNVLKPLNLSPQVYLFKPNAQKQGVELSYKQHHYKQKLGKIHGYKLFLIPLPQPFKGTPLRHPLKL